MVRCLVRCRIIPSNLTYIEPIWSLTVSWLFVSSKYGFAQLCAYVGYQKWARCCYEHSCQKVWNHRKRLFSDYSHSAPIEFSNEKHSSLSEEEKKKKLEKLEQYLNNVFCVMYHFIYRSKWTIIYSIHILKSIKNWSRFMLSNHNTALNSFSFNTS